MKKEVSSRRVSEYMNPATPVVSSRTSVQDALDLVRGNGFSALPVCEEGRFLGMVRERDLLAMTPSQATSLSRFEIQTLLDKVTVGTIMKFPPATVALDRPLREAAEIMVKNSSDVLPVVDQDRFAGLIPQLILAQCMARLPIPGAGGAQQLETWFKGPVFHDSDVNLFAQTGAEGARFQLVPSGEERPAILGRWSSGAGGIRMPDENGKEEA